MCPTDDKILEAALAVLAREGYGGATTKKIAEEAGINEVTLFRKFKSKENLIKQAKNLGLKRSIESMERTFESIDGGDLESSMSALGKHMSESMDKKTNIVTAIIEMQRRPVCEKNAPHYSTVMIDHLTKYFEEQIEKGNMRNVNPRVAALSFFSFIFYMDFICKLRGQESGVNGDRALEEFMDIFMNGVRSPEKNKE